MSLYLGYIGKNWNSLVLKIYFFPFKNIPDKSKLLLDVSARLWFTYRRKFSPIGEYTADLLPH